MKKISVLPVWMIVAVLGLALILAAAGIIYGWQAYANSRLANQSLATAQSAEQLTRSQLATAESAEQKAAEQQAIAESEAQKARSAQATAESEAQQRATAEAAAAQERETAREQADLATSRWLAGEAINMLPIDSQLSGHLALQAFDAGNTFEAENALHQVLPYLRLLKSTPITDIAPTAKNLTPGNLSLARDGELLLVGIAEGIEVVDLASGAHSVLAQGEDCGGIAATRDGGWLVANCDGEWQVWEVGTKTLLSNLPNNWGYAYYLIPPTSTHPLLAISIGETVHVVDVRPGKEQLAILSSAHDYWVGAIASPDASRLFLFSGDGQVALWELDTITKLAQFDTQLGISSAALSPDSTRLATLGWDDLSRENKIKILDISSLSHEPKLVQELNRGKLYIGIGDAENNNLMYSSDGRYLVVGSGDGPIQVWNTEDGLLQLTLSGHTEESWPLAFSKDGTHLFTGSRDGNLNEWDLSPGEELKSLPGRIGSAPNSPDGKHLAIMGEDGYLSIVDSQTGEVELSWQAHTEWSYWSDVAWSPDGEHLATLGTSADTLKLKIWEAANGQLFKELPRSYPYLGFAWSPDSSQLAAFHGDGHISIWDSANGEELLALEGDYYYPIEMNYSPDGTKIAAGGSYCGWLRSGGEDVSCSYQLDVWDAATGKKLFTLESETGQASRPGGKRLAFTLTDSFTSDADDQRGSRRLSWQANSGQVADALLSMQTERQVLSSHGKTTRVLVSTNGSEYFAQRFRPSFAYSSWMPFAMAFSPDGQHLAAGTPNGIILWTITDDRAEQEQVFDTQGSNHGYDSLAFSPDGALLAAVDDSGKTRVWDVESGKVRWEVPSAGGGNVAFSQDGTRLVYNSEVYILPLDELTELVRSLLIRPMTLEECQTYLHQETCPQSP